MKLTVLIHRQRSTEPRRGELRAWAIMGETTSRSKNILEGRSLTNIESAKQAIREHYARKLVGIAYEIQWKVSE